MDLNESNCLVFHGYLLSVVCFLLACEGFGSYRVRKIFSGYVKNFPLYVFVERADLTHTLVHQALDRDAAMHSTSHDVFNAHTCECHRHGFDVTTWRDIRSLTKHHDNMLTMFVHNVCKHVMHVVVCVDMCEKIFSWCVCCTKFWHIVSKFCTLCVNMLHNMFTHVCTHTRNAVYIVNVYNVHAFKKWSKNGQKLPKKGSL